MKLELTKKEQNLLSELVEKKNDKMLENIMNKKSNDKTIDEFWSSEIVQKINKKIVKKIINEVVKKEARKEASDIMSKCDKKYIDDLISQYLEKSFNVVCMIIDCAKWKLIQDKKMKSKKNDHFGVPGLDFEVRSKKTIKKVKDFISKHYKK